MKNKWTIKAGNGKKVEFEPVFKVYENPTQEGKDVECSDIVMRIDDKEYVFNFINIFQFIYFVANEELRQQLQTRYQRRINRIPYDVTFKLSKDEIDAGMAKRRIDLPIDEITMAIARNEAWKLMPKVAIQTLTGKKPWELFKKRSN